MCNNHQRCTSSVTSWAQEQRQHQCLWEQSWDAPPTQSHCGLLQHQHRATVACYFVLNSVGLTNLASPIASQHGDNEKLGQDDSPWDYSGYIPGALNTMTNITVVVHHSDKSLEPDILASLSLLLHWQDPLFFRHAPRKASINSDSLMFRTSM